MCTCYDFMCTHVRIHIHTRIIFISWHVVKHVCTCLNFMCVYCLWLLISRGYIFYMLEFHECIILTFLNFHVCIFSMTTYFTWLYFWHALNFHMCLFSMAINFTWVYIFLCAYLLVYSRVQIICMVVFLCVSEKYSNIKITIRVIINGIRYNSICNLLLHSLVP